MSFLKTFFTRLGYNAEREKTMYDVRAINNSQRISLGMIRSSPTAVIILEVIASTCNTAATNGLVLRYAPNGDALHVVRNKSRIEFKGEILKNLMKCGTVSIGVHGGRIDLTDVVIDNITIPDYNDALRYLYELGEIFLSFGSEKRLECLQYTTGTAKSLLRLFSMTRQELIASRNLNLVIQHAPPNKVVHTVIDNVRSDLTIKTDSRLHINNVSWYGTLYLDVDQTSQTHNTGVLLFGTRGFDKRVVKTKHVLPMINDWLDNVALGQVIGHDGTLYSDYTK